MRQKNAATKADKDNIKSKRSITEEMKKARLEESNE